MVLTGARSRLDSVQKLASLPVRSTPPGTDQAVRQQQRRLTPAEVVTLARAYRAGTDMQQLAHSFGVHRTTVSEHLRRLGIPLRRQGLADGDLAQAISLYAAGWSLTRLGERFGCDAETVRQAFIQAGIARRSPA